MPLVPLYGHRSLREQLGERARANALPASLLLHGQRGVGKQRFALWLGQTLLCVSADAPCGTCEQCRFALAMAHPDLHWIYPRPRLKDSDASIEEIRADLREGTVERMGNGGLYPPPSGSDGIFVATIRAIIQSASMSPAMARRKVVVVGDAERMVPQEGSEFAANAFLKLLEEPPANTTIILTSSEPGALLPTIRSRVVSIRVPLVADADVRALLKDPQVAAALDEADLPESEEERLRVSGGAPGRLFAEGGQGQAVKRAKALLEAVASAKTSDRIKAAFNQGFSGARGAFSDTLDALTVLLHEKLRDATKRGDRHMALAASRAVDSVELAKQQAQGNVSPQLVSAVLLRDLAARLR